MRWVDGAGGAQGMLIYADRSALSLSKGTSIIKVLLVETASAKERSPKSH